MLDLGVARIDVSSQDRFHLRASRERRPALEALFRSRGMAPAGAGEGGPVYDFWGATEDRWIGPLWPRGRARTNGLSRAGPEHRYCALWSGARGFLDYRAPGSEVNIQLADVYPCCPGTLRPLGSLLEEPLIAILDRCAAQPVFRALNEGRPEAMGGSLGISEEHGARRTRELGNHCLWCDEFFRLHAPELLRGPAQDEEPLPMLG
jgi:hypothetical protein